MASLKLNGLHITPKVCRNIGVPGGAFIGHFGRLIIGLKSYSHEVDEKGIDRLFKAHSPHSPYSF